MISENNTKRFCNEDISKIENYDKAIKDTTRTWVCHHRLEIREGYRNTVSDLILMGLYYNRPANELIFLTNGEHTRLHNLSNNHLGKNFRNSEVQKNNSKRAWCKLRGIDTDDPIKYYDEHHNEKLKIVYGKHHDWSGENNPMWGKSAWDISCNKKTEAEIQQTRDSKRMKMRSFWSSKEGKERKKQMGVSVSRTKSNMKKLKQAIHEYIILNKVKVLYED